MNTDIKARNNEMIFFTSVFICVIRGSKDLNL
jgi:hypothetical protein